MVEALAASLAANGFVVHRVAPGPGGAAEAEALVGQLVTGGAGVTVGLAGLVESGSVALAAAPGEPRANSLLCDVHVTLLHDDRILPGLPELFAAVGGELPSSLAVVSGPSRSGDIEGMLIVGVHGPREEHVVLLPAGAPLPAAATGRTADDYRTSGPGA